MKQALKVQLDLKVSKAQQGRRVRQAPKVLRAQLGRKAIRDPRAFKARLDFGDSKVSKAQPEHKAS